MPKQLHIFFNALTFFTRIPAPRWVVFQQDYLNRAAAYFPLVGAIVGVFAGLICWLSLHVVPLPIAVLLAIASSAWLTGCFHEDGFGDVCDGFGAGWQRDQILTIMKDSRLGTYGVVGLFFLLMLKYQTLLALPELRLPLLLLVGHVVSRWSAVLLIAFGVYAKQDEASKAKPLAKQLGWPGFVLATLCTAGSLAWLDYRFAILVLVIQALVAAVAYRWFNRKIGGYTGDCLGALQQVNEWFFYLLALLVFNGTLPFTPS